MSIEMRVFLVVAGLIGLALLAQRVSAAARERAGQTPFRSRAVILACAAGALLLVGAGLKTLGKKGPSHVLPNYYERQLQHEQQQHINEVLSEDDGDPYR
jgi:hypothetical protein